MLFLFSAGFALLPFVWAINTVWFFNEAFRKPAYEEQKSIRKCKNNKKNFTINWYTNISFLLDVLMSGVGALIWFGLIVAWIVSFQKNRAAWGEWADSISFIIPLGMP